MRDKSGMRIIYQLSFWMLLLLSAALWANERQSDPDGCLVCHALEGLQYIDKKGTLRVASIDQADYYASLHGSVPCTDCHQIKTYPHEVKEGLVDCAAECHVNEPSKGEKFTHKAVVKEFVKSTHGLGRVKDFAGGNRLEEDNEPDPSCRRCHSNTPYIIPTQLEKFKTELHHTDIECGKCHVGTVWMQQFGGHVLRRLVGSRWNKTEINKSCTQCHADSARMAKVKIEDPAKRQANLQTLAETGEGITDGKPIAANRTLPVTYRWIHSTESYDRTLHSRILVAGDEQGASCLDCHIHHGKGFNGHGILKDEDKSASTHPEQLGKTCGASGCHHYAQSAFNTGFILTDVHDLDQIHLPHLKALIDPSTMRSVWYWAAWILMVFCAAFGCASVYWLVMIYPHYKKTANNIIGDERFEEVMLGRKPKKAQAKPTAVAAKPTPAKPATAVPTDKPAVSAPSAVSEAPVSFLAPKTDSALKASAKPDTAELPPMANTPSAEEPKS